MSSKKYIYQHRYSSVENKIPSADTIYTGEIMVNGAAGHEKLFIKNSSGDVVSFDRIIVDDALSSGSTNPVANSAVTKVILDNEEVISAALNDLNDRKAERASAITDASISSNTSAYTLSFENESGDTLFSVEFEKGGDGKPLKEGTDIKIVSGDSFDTIYVSADTVINSASTHVVQAKTIHAELEKKQVKNIEITQEDYDALVDAGTLDLEALYIIIDAQEVDASQFVTSGSISSNTSAYTLSFSGTNGELFSVDFNKGGDGKKMIAGDNISIVSGASADTISVSGASAITSSSTEVVQSKAIYEELDKKLDKVNFINNLYPKGSIYITYEDKNPSTFLGGEWELISKGRALFGYDPDDADFASGATGGGKNSGVLWSTNWNEALGDYAITKGINSNPTTITSNNTLRWSHEGYATTGQTTITYGENGTSTDNIAKKLKEVRSINDSGDVQDNSLPPYQTVYVWRRTDDGTIVEQITPLDVDVEDVLWEGSQGQSTNVNITLSDSIENYKQLKFYSKKDANGMVDEVDVKDVNATTSSLEIIKEHGWDSSLRYLRFHKTSDTTLEMDFVDLTLYKITGIRAIPTTDISAIDFQTFYKTVNMTSIGSFTADITVPSGYVPAGIGSTIIRTDGAVGYGYCDKVVKVSDTVYRFTGWANPNGIGSGAVSITVYATFIKGPYTNLVEFVTAGDGINVSSTGVVSVEHPTNVIEVTGKIDVNGYLTNVGGVASAKVRLPKNAIMTGVNVKQISNLTVGTGFQIIFFQYYYPSEDYSQWCFRILNWDDTKLGEKTTVVADISYILN